MSAICPLEPVLNLQYWFCPEAELHPTVLLWVPSAIPATVDAQTWLFRPCGLTLSTRGFR